MKSRELYKDTLWCFRKLFCQLLFCLAVCLFFLSPSPAIADLPISLSTTYSDPSQVYVTFQTSFPSTFSASYHSNSVGGVVQIKAAPAPSFLTPSIQLSDIKDGIINLNFMNSGLIYASLGGPLGQKTPPDPRNPSDPAYNLAWQPVAEITYTGVAADSGDMTSINFFGLPNSVSVYTKNNTELVQEAGFVISSAQLIDNIKKLSTTPDRIVIKNTTDQVVRVLSPNSFGYSVDQFGTPYFDIAGYPSFEDYVKSVHDANRKTAIQGNLNQGNYNFVSSVNASLDIVTKGDYGTGVTYTITIPHDRMLTDGSGLVNYTQSSALYLCPTVALPTTGVEVKSSNGTPIDGGELGQILHDLTSGYNFGFINSQTIDTITGIAFGDEPSSAWFAHGSRDKLYEKLQPNNPYYNQYAKVISDASDGAVYGFPYSDAVEKVALFTVEYPSIPPSKISSWHIVIGPPASP